LISDDLNLIIFLIALFFVGLYGIFSGLKNYLFVNKIKNIAVSSVASAAIGLVELSGRASSDAPEPGPVSGTPCVYWRITGEYYYSSGKSGHWDKFYEVTSTKRFYIKDDTGRMHIDPEGGKTNIVAESHRGHIAEHGLLPHEPADMDEKVMNYIRSLESTAAAEFARHEKNLVRVTEYRIADNDPLYVMGSVEPIRDTSGAGPDETLEIRKGDTDKTLYISTMSERQVIRKFSSWMHLKIFGGLALCAGVLFGALNLNEPEVQDWGFLIIVLFFAGVMVLSLYKAVRSQ
jgi:hypothetical protein